MLFYQDHTMCTRELMCTCAVVQCSYACDSQTTYAGINSMIETVIAFNELRGLNIIHGGKLEIKIDDS